jgi:hypothetical protein
MSTNLFTLECGAKVHWSLKTPFEDYELQVVCDPQKDSKKSCGNPFNWMTPSEYKEITQMRPKNTNKPCKLECMMEQQFFYDTKTVAAELIDFIGADCWGVFTTTQKRDKIVKMYFDTRTDGDDEDSDKLRDKLIEDPAELIDAMNNGLTVVIVMGSKRFIESYFFKVQSPENQQNQNQNLPDIYVNVANHHYTD